MKDKGVAVLVLDVKETKEEAQAYAAKSKFTFPVLLDSDAAAILRFAPSTLGPGNKDELLVASNLIIDPEGKIQFFTILNSRNFDAEMGDLRAKLKELMASRAGP